MKRIIIAVFGLALMQAGAAASPVHYTYTGNPFTPGYGPFAGASITATLYFSSALPDNDTYSNLIPPPTLVSYTVSAGSLTMTDSDSSIVLSLDTNAMGAIDSWGMQFNNSSGLISSSGPGVESEDSASNSMTYGNNTDDPGTWSPAEATPLPAALPLFASVLGGLSLFGWWRERKARAAVA